MNGAGNPVECRGQRACPGADEQAAGGTLRRPRWRWQRRLLHLAIVGLALMTLGAAALLCADRVWPFPVERLNRWPASPLVTDRAGEPLLTVVGTDEQWRYPVPLDRMAPWLGQATLAVEDERFYRHGGVDLIAVARAIGQNLAARRVVSGASTLTMQICRMIDDRPRTLAAKTIETLRALQLERTMPKDRILECYLNIAPYGRNIRGAEAASQAYFGKRAADLSLGEAALLAGLPQSPSRFRPDRYPDAARARRRTVLRRMRELGMITPEQLAHADQDPLTLAGPGAGGGASAPAHDSTAGSAEPRLRTAVAGRATLSGRSACIAPHAAILALQRRPAGGRTTIDPIIQREAQRLAAEFVTTLPDGSQVAVVVIDIARSEIVAMVGAADADNPVDGQVNGATARRSPGSALKPFIYAAAIDAGLINAESTVYDVPIDRAGWSPANFDSLYVGELSAAEALRRSLNVPAILVAEATGLSRCLGVIEAAGVRLPPNVQARGGLAVVVGAVEVSLLDMVNGYATLGRGGVRRPARLFLDEPADAVPVIASDVCAIVDDILSTRHRRPRGIVATELPWFMWKTGTSSGRRDAWAAGHNRRFAVGVWVGRFCGGGSVQYVGAEAAEPLLAALFDVPLLRARDAPPPTPHRPVTQPLAPPAELRDPVRIVSPSDGSTHVAIDGQAIVHPRATQSVGLTWFLNGAMMDAAGVNRLTLEPGRYELRCVDSQGASAAVRFTVLASPRPMRTPRHGPS